jgi:hypothetical protein
MKVLGMSSGLNEFHDFANFNIGVHGLSLRERHLRRKAEIADGSQEQPAQAITTTPRP